MSRRTILSLLAATIIGIGWLGLFRLTPPHIALVSIGVGSTAAASTVVATTVVYAREWRSASVLPLLVLQLSALQPWVAAAPVGCPYGYYYYAPYNRCVPTP